MQRAYRLRNSVFSVDRDYPKEISQARKELYSSKEAKEGRRKQLKVQIKYPARLYVDGRFVTDKFPEWFKILGQSRVEGFEPDIAKDKLSSSADGSSRNYTHDRQGQNRVHMGVHRDSRDNSVHRGVDKSPWLSQQDDWNERRTPQGSPVRRNNDISSPVASQRSPSLLDRPVQNVNNNDSSASHVIGHVSPERPRERSHSNDSRVSAINNQENRDLPESINIQRPVFKSPQRSARDRNVSNNVNSANNNSKTESGAKKTAQGRSASASMTRRQSLSQSVVTPTEISNTENHKNYYMTEVMCPMGSFKYNYVMWSLDICLDQTP